MRTILIFKKLRLAPNAAESYKRMRAADLPRGGINSAFRSIEEQRRIFLRHYKPTANHFTDTGKFDDVRFYDGVWYKRVHRLPASVPGRSKHSQGLAIDTSVGKPVFTWLDAHGAQHGWRRPIPRADPVHWEYTARKDKAKRANAGVHVITALVLRGRDAPSLHANIVSRRRKGTTVFIEQWVRGEGRLWGRTPGGVFFAKEFLKKRP